MRIFPYNLRLFIASVAVVISLTSSSFAQEIPANVVLQVTDARNTMEVWVKKVKGKYALSTTEYMTAKTKYELAKAKYDAWISAVQAAILSDKLKKLQKSPEYKTNIAQAKAAGQDFLNYVAKLNIDNQTKKIVPLLSSFIDVGNKIVDAWFNFRKKQIELKVEQTKLLAALEKYSEKFATLSQWKAWDTI